ncbi:hypothetical protein SMF913_13459 [Streptomyces malaysiensis]|uniref:Uncharacterized protein n=1 Tax=Streptomyces malaysiensis TaxID=92644 RepID=A0A2J7ZAX2_STRMQ|nr:hypothetical protein SMF913_13459 [Streptomyces malaysiensis]
MVIIESAALEGRSLTEAPALRLARASDMRVAGIAFVSPGPRMFAP